MFKIGDKVVCINVSHNDVRGLINLKLHEIYTISDISFVDVTMYISLNDEEPGYFSTRFKLLSEVRKEKLNKLINV